ncbi:MAG: serine/threonine protein kinase [bacterium]|nr:serine/threonine protein kinase [bacterium]
MSTRTQRWQRVKDLVDETLDLPAVDRTAFLDRACDGGDDLRREVEALLEREDQLGGFLARPFFSLRTDGDPDLDRQLGPYRLARRLGSGGMGTVYLAQRTGDDLRQRVAVKLLKRGLDSEEMVRRFQIERQILADLSHPYVARLLDVGTAEDGRPFFAMEYVEGERIDAWCDARRLGTRQRVTLFRQVCEAIHFAHQNLVVHRDLKPANILVTAEGTPKLLDFGIAKLLDRDPGLTAVTVAPGPAPLSLPYASPEQLAGGPITTAADVYALGVMLYKILTGRRPHRLNGLGAEEAARLLRREKPVRPSIAVGRSERSRRADGSRDELTPESVSRVRDGEPRRLARHLRGDLDNIVLKALSPEPERRFSSAEQLSEDLRRHLEGLPVRSRPDTFLYCAGKFVGRYTFAVATATLVAILVLGFGVAMAVQGQKIVRQSQEIARERDRADWVTDFLVHLPETPAPDGAASETLTLRDALDAGVERLHREYAEEPKIRAALLDAMGSSYRRLLVYDQARPLLEKALHLRRDLYGEDHVLVAETMHNLANLERDEGNGEKAEVLMRRALEIQHRHFPEGHRDLARGLNNLARLLPVTRKEVEALARESLEMKERLFGPEHRELTKPLYTLAFSLRNRGKLEEAENLYRRCLALRRRLEDPMSPELANVLNALAGLLVERDKLKEAASLYEEALKIRRHLYAGDHPRLVSILNNLGRLRILLDEPKPGGALLEEGSAMAHRLAADKKLSDGKLAVVEKNLAWARLESGEFSACEELARLALAVFRQRKSVRRVAETKSILGGCLMGLERFEEAEPLLSEGHESLLETAGEDALVTRLARERLLNPRR